MDKQQIEQKIKETLLQYLNAGKKVTLTWDCGGDEAFVYTSIDGNELSSFIDNEYSPDSFPALLEHYIITQLHLPDAGEFSLEGKGEILIENNQLVIVYEATNLSYEDWSYEEEAEEEEEEETQQNIDDEDYLEEEEYNSTYVNASPEEYAEYSGKKVLFKL